MKALTLGRSALGLTGLLLTMLAPLAQAQDNPPIPPAPLQSGPGGPGGNPGGPGGNPGGRGGFGNRGGGRGGFAGRFSMGTVSAVDTAAGTLTLTPNNGGEAQTVKLGPAATVMTQETIPVSRLRVGENVRVTGVPVTITASQIVAGDLPTGLPGGGRRVGANAQPGGAGAQPGGLRRTGAASGTTTMSASVLSLNPLTLSVGDNVAVALKLAPDAKVSRISSTTLGQVKVGDQIVATGQT